jgi:hypothetical protein
LQNPRFELFLKKSPVLTAEQKRRNEESREAENKEYTATFNQHSLPIFIASPILSTHNDGLNRGNVRNTNLAPMTIWVLPNYGTGETRALKNPKPRELSQAKSNAQQ